MQQVTSSASQPNLSSLLKQAESSINVTRNVLNGLCTNSMNKPKPMQQIKPAQLLLNNENTNINAAAVLQLIYQQQLINESAVANAIAATTANLSNNPNAQSAAAVAAAAAAAATRYKTELCRSFQENGTCKYGDKCQFAHGHNELRNMMRHPRYKTELCRTFHAAGYCPYGPRCHFVHDTSFDAKQAAKQNPKANANNLSLKLTQQLFSSSSSSNSSSNSTSPLQCQPNQQTQFQFDFNAANEDLISVNNSTQSLLMCADASSANPSLAVSKPSQRKESTSSAVSTSSSQIGSSRYSSGSGTSSANISPPSSRSLSPETFNSNTYLAFLNDDSTCNQTNTNDLFYSLINSNSKSEDLFLSSSSSASSTSSSELECASTHDSTTIVNQILNNLYANGTKTSNMATNAKSEQSDNENTVNYLTFATSNLLI